MDANHEGAAEIAPLRERFFTIGLGLKFCFEGVHEEKITRLKIHCQPHAYLFLCS